MTKLPASPWRSLIFPIVLSGQIGLKDGQLVPGGFLAEFRQAMANVAEVLTASHIAVTNIAHIRVSLTEFNRDYSAVSRAFRELFEDPYPSCTCSGATALPHNACVQLEVLVNGPPNGLWWLFQVDLLQQRIHQFF